MTLQLPSSVAQDKDGKWGPPQAKAKVYVSTLGISKQLSAATSKIESENFKKREQANKQKATPKQQ